MTNGVLAKAVYNPNWLKIFEDLVVPKQYPKVKMNNQITTLILTKVLVYYFKKGKKELSDAFKFFGILQFALLENTPSIVAISLVKVKVGSRF